MNTGPQEALLALRDTPLEVAEVLAAVQRPDAGGTALFVGTVRDHDGGRAGVELLAYSAHPSAETVMREVALEVAARHPVHALAVVHRVGDLRVGDLAIVAAVSCAHRGDAFAACRELVDAIKARVPIWKHQRFEDGSQEWVGVD